MAPLFIFFVLLLHWTKPICSVVSVGHANTPVSRIKIPNKLHEISYKGSIFSYASNGRHSVKPIRDYVLENESIKQMEDSFTEHLTETILSKLSAQMRTGIPAMSIPPLDPLRLRPIRVDPTYGGNDVFTIFLNDIEVHGLSDFDIQDLRPKLNALKVRLAFMFPKLKATCHFAVNGSVYQVVDVSGEGHAELEYSDVLFRTQLSLLHENNTFQIDPRSDPPLIDFANAKIKLTKRGANESTETGMASELGPLLFWVLADHVVQEVDEYLLKYVNNNMLLFKVPESFTPVVTWLMHRSSVAQNHLGMSPFQIGRFSPFPFLNHWINSLSNFNRPSSMNTINTRLFRRK